MKGRTQERPADYVKGFWNWYARVFRVRPFHHRPLWGVFFEDQVRQQVCQHVLLTEELPRVQWCQADMNNSYTPRESTQMIIMSPGHFGPKIMYLFTQPTWESTEQEHRGNFTRRYGCLLIFYLQRLSSLVHNSTGTDEGRWILWCFYMPFNFFKTFTGFEEGFLETGFFKNRHFTLDI